MSNVKNPKYDNDIVTLGYLNERIGEGIVQPNGQSSSNNIPKNYSAPPVPPYYVDSLLAYNGKLYKCTTERKSGNFNWEDWTVIATDDTTINNFLKNVYSLDKIEIQEQIDEKIQSYRQDTDPSIDWATDIERERHKGDYWYNTSDNTQWCYVKYPTNPVTYGWGQIDVPNSVYDKIDGKKSIYTSKPNSYSKDDMWIIESTLSDEDLPVDNENPIARGDWVFSISDSDTYDKSHWKKYDENVKITYLENYYYKKEVIDTTIEELERNVESEITKAKDAVLISVEQTYTTKETTTELETRVGDTETKVTEIETSTITNTEDIAQIEVSVGNITNTVSSQTTSINELEENQTNLERRQAQTELDVNGFKIEVQSLSGTISDMAYHFGTDALQISNSNSKINALLNNTGLKIYNYDVLNSIFTDKGTGIDKLIVTGTAQIGYLKFGKATTGLRKNKKCTQIFVLDNLVENLEDLESE